MKRTSFAVTNGLLVSAAFLLLLSGCYTNGPVRSTGYQGRAAGQGEVAVTYEDDYDYYPGYEVYYSRSRHEYVYRDANAWVRRPQPSGVSLDVLLASPAVRMDFRDAPELHHDTVIRSYPKNWKRPENKSEVKQDKSDQQDGNKKDERR